MQQEQNPCASYNMNLLQCIKSSSDNIGLCQDYMNMLNQCQQQMGQGNSMM